MSEPASLSDLSTLIEKSRILTDEAAELKRRADHLRERIRSIEQAEAILQQVRREKQAQKNGGRMLA